jgi:hypothetical protein
MWRPDMGVEFGAWEVDGMFVIRSAVCRIRTRVHCDRVERTERRAHEALVGLLVRLRPHVALHFSTYQTRWKDTVHDMTDRQYSYYFF